MKARVIGLFEVQVPAGVFEGPNIRGILEEADRKLVPLAVEIPGTANGLSFENLIGYLVCDEETGTLSELDPLGEPKNAEDGDGD